MLYAILHDLNVWPDAEHFNPEANFPTAVSSDEERELLACRMQSFSLYRSVLGSACASARDARATGAVHMLCGSNAALSLDLGIRA